MMAAAAQARRLQGREASATAANRIGKGHSKTTWWAEVPALVGEGHQEPGDGHEDQ